MKPPILKPWHSVVQPVDQKACVLADIAISKGNGGLDVFNGYRLCFSLHRQATPRERIISTVRIFSEKGKASLSQPAEARSCPLRFRSSKTSSTPHKRIGPQENLSNSFPSLPHLTGMSCRFLSRHCIFRPSESKETVGVSPPSREKQVQVHGRESTGVLFGKKWQRNASQSAPPRVIYSDWNPFLLRMESSPSMRIL